MQLIDKEQASYVEEKVVMDFIQLLNNKYGQESPIKSSFAKIHKYLGMILDHSKEGYVIMTITNTSCFSMTV